MNWIITLVKPKSIAFNNRHTGTAGEKAIDSPQACDYDVRMGKILSFALDTAARLIDRIPIERVLVKQPDTSDDRKELISILDPKKKPETPEREEGSGRLEPRRSRPQPPREQSVSTEETVDYQDREICKTLLQIEKHAAKKFRINGKACDCGQSRHLLDLEGMAEETVSMVEDSDVYYRLLDWVKDIGPKTTIQAVESGQYDAEYPQISTQARDFRKEIIGTLDPQALWPNSSVSFEDMVRKGKTIDTVAVEKPEEKPLQLNAHFEIVPPAAEPEATKEAPPEETKPPEG